MNRVFLLVVASLAFANMQAFGDDLKLSGFVIDANTLKPISEVSVSAVGRRANPRLTDSDGKFILTFDSTVRMGESIQLSFQKVGYYPYKSTVPVGNGDKAPGRVGI